MAIEGYGSIQYGDSSKRAEARVLLGEDDKGVPELVISGHNIYANGEHEKQGVRFAVRLKLTAEEFIELSELGSRGAAMRLAGLRRDQRTNDALIARLEQEGTKLKHALGAAAVEDLLGAPEERSVRRHIATPSTRHWIMTTDGVVRVIGHYVDPGETLEGLPVVGCIDAGEGYRDFLVASSAGYGFRASASELPSSESSPPKTVLVVPSGAKASVFRPIEAGHDSVAVVGENRKMLVFPMSDLPTYVKAKGANLQSYRDGGMSDAITFGREEGLTWTDPSNRQRTVTDVADWMGNRGTSGRMAPRGFPRDNRFASQVE